MIKNVWKMEQGEIAIINEKRYKIYKTAYEIRPRVGRVLIRTLVNIDNPKDRLKFMLNNVDVEIKQPIQAAERIEDRYACHNL